MTCTASLDEILTRSDFVVLACGYNPSTHLLIGERELRLMKPTALLINTGRGRLVDEPATIRALQNKTIAGAGLDVCWNELGEEWRHSSPNSLYSAPGGLRQERGRRAKWPPVARSQ